MLDQGETNLQHTPRHTDQPMSQLDIGRKEPLYRSELFSHTH